MDDTAMSKPWSQSDMIYSGADRRDFGMQRVTPVQTPPDRGPWPWDRTGGPDDIDTEPRHEAVSSPHRFHKTGPTAEGRTWVLAMETGTEFRLRDLFQTIGKTKFTGNSIATGILKTLKDLGSIEKVGYGRWRRT